MMIKLLCAIRDLLTKISGGSTSNTALLEAILKAINEQGELLNDTPLKLDVVCFDTGGTSPVMLLPVVTIVDGAVKSTQYFLTDGTAYTGQKPVPADPCDCACEVCEGDEDCKVTIKMDGFDLDDGIVESGQTSVFRVSNAAGEIGVLEHDYTTTSDDVNKSSYYTPLIALINSVPDFSISLDTDVQIGSQGKPTWLLTYTGAGDDALIIQKADSVGNLNNGDTLTWKVSETCENKGNASWDGQGSDPFNSGGVVLNPKKNAYSLKGVERTETKIGYDDPSFSSAFTGIPLINWTKADLVAVLNGDAGLAIPPNVLSGIDYSATTWSVHPTSDAIVATGANIPATIDLVNLGISIPMTTI